MKETLIYKSDKEMAVICLMCMHKCKIRNGELGKCSVRKNVDGVLSASTYGNVSARAVDPVEKKPLYHFLPDSTTYSFATSGCNFSCSFCQNSDLSQRDINRIPSKKFSPQEIVNEAIQNGVSSISYTYSEPTIFFEYAYNTGILAREQGLKNIFVTNGFMTKDTHEYLAHFLDGANIDLKSFSDETYKDVMGGRLKPVLDNIEKLFDLGIVLEITTLLIHGLNDSKEELRNIAKFIYNVSPVIPWHITAFHPAYKMLDRPATKFESLNSAGEIGLEEGLKHIYLGNVQNSTFKDTFCASCGELLIKRAGNICQKLFLNKNKCPKCNTVLYGVF